MRIIRQIIPFALSRQIFNSAKVYYFSWVLPAVWVVLAEVAGVTAFSHWYQPGSPCLVFLARVRVAAVMCRVDSIPLQEDLVGPAALEEY
jgi:hypothetical protein